MLLRDAALDALGEQRLGLRSGRVGARVREVQELLVLERLRRRAVVGPVGVELEELLDALRTTIDAPREPATQVGRLVAASTGIAAAETICTILMRMYQRLLRRAPCEYQRICSSRRCHEADDGASLGALPDLGEDSAGWAMGVVVALTAEPASSCARLFSRRPPADRSQKVRLATDFVSRCTILSRFGPPKRDRSAISPATAPSRRR